MPVYVDNMHTVAMGRLGRMKMSHMIADTRQELDAMADAIGVQSRWIQYPGTWKEHYDVAMAARAKAVAAGAIEIDMRIAAMMNRRRRATGELGTPETAQAWFDADYEARRAAASETQQGP